MVVLDGNIEWQTEAGHAVLHPAADRGFMNGSDALRHLPGGDEVIPPQVFLTRHPETQRQSGPEGKSYQQKPQTIAEFWDEQDDGWW